ncbi:MAG: N-acetyl-gamma-glutamyl-phosphate reductase [Aquificaceae bacterium]
MEQTLRVCIYGATGYTGIELLRILLNHPYVRVVSLTSQTYKGKYISELFPYFSDSYVSNMLLVEEPNEEFDLAFLCLPHDASLELVPNLLEMGKKVIDLSGAYRIRNASLYPEFYGFEHKYPYILERAVYGLPEVFRDSIKSADIVSNPGCYPTAALLSIYPLLKAKVDFEKVVIDAISGVSGAGRKTAQSFHYPEMEQNTFAYSISKHRHTPEIENVIERVSGRDVSVRFTPKVVPMSRGMLSTTYLYMERLDLLELFTETYREEKYVKTVSHPPMTKYVLGTNLCLIFPYYDERTGIALIVSAMDNLGKGASGQAVQNMNLMIGMEETVGIEKIALFP